MKRAVYINCDGLCTDWISPERTPALAALSARGLRCAEHRAIFSVGEQIDVVDAAVPVGIGQPRSRVGADGQALLRLTAGRKQWMRRWKTRPERRSSAHRTFALRSGP